MFHGVPFSSTGGFSTQSPSSLPAGLWHTGQQQWSLYELGATPHVPSPAPAGCPLLPGQSYVTINDKSLSDATSESAQGPGPWDPFPLGPPSMGLSPGVAVPAEAEHEGVGLWWHRVCPEPQQEVTMNPNCVAAAAPAVRAASWGFSQFFFCAFFLPTHTLFSLFSTDCPS